MDLVDCHTHTLFSDGSGQMRDSAEAAVRRGITTLCYTDHLTLPASLDPSCEVSIPEKLLPSYREAVLDTRSAFPMLDIVLGFECDYYPGCEFNVARWTDGATYRLGSVHMLDGQWIDDPSNPGYWSGRSTEEVWIRYFEVWGEACQSPCHFDSMAHPDLVSLFGREPDNDLQDRLFDRAAEAAQASGIRIEVNTAGLTKPIGRMYPAPDLLKRFCKAGVRATVGSDAHAPQRIGEGIEDAYRFLYTCGYRSIDVPTSQGGWRSIEL